MRTGWTIYQETPTGWRRITRNAWTFPTACRIAQAMQAAGRSGLCVNFAA